MLSKWSDKGKNVLYLPSLQQRTSRNQNVHGEYFELSVKTANELLVRRKFFMLRASKEIKIHESYQPYYLVWSWAVIIKGSFTNLPLSYKAKEKQLIPTKKANNMEA